MKQMKELEANCSNLSSAQLDIFKQSWTSLSSRFQTSDQASFAKIKEQAEKESQQFIDNRLLKSMESSGFNTADKKIDSKFLDLFRNQL